MFLWSSSTKWMSVLRYLSLVLLGITSDDIIRQKIINFSFTICKTVLLVYINGSIFRSFNVHVTGALVIWEYVKQMS